MANTVNNFFNIDNIKTKTPGYINSEHYPEIINACYTNDLNILKIHEAILYKFGVINYKLINNSTEFNEEFILNYSNNKEWNIYYNNVIDILIEYIPLATNKIKGIINISYSRSENSDEEDENNIEDKNLYKRLYLIEKYLIIAKKYIILNINWNLEMEYQCSNCNKENCMCFGEKLFNHPVIFKNTNYNVLNTFIKALNKYEGNYVVNIPQSLIDDLDKYFLSIGFQKGEYYKQFVINSKNTFGLKIKLLITALQKTNNSKHYHIINIIAFNYWGWQYPNLTNIRDQIIEDFKKTQEIYDTIKDRDSNLNINIRIYAHLKSKDFDCDFDDFKTLITRNALVYHNTMLTIMFEKVGLKYVPII